MPKQRVEDPIAKMSQALEGLSRTPELFLLSLGKDAVASLAGRFKRAHFDDITNERYSGTLHTNYTYVGTFRVTVPAGSFEAILLRAKVEGRIGPAHTHGASYSFFAPGAGLIAMILQQKVTAFWIYNINSAGGKVLVSK